MSNPQPTQVNIYEAKTQLSRLVARAAAGEEIIIARAGRPAARLVALRSPPRDRRPGGLVGLVELTEDWDSEETNERVAALFGVLPDTGRQP